MMIPNVTKSETREHINARGNREYIVTVWMEFTFMDGETGETISFNTVGEGQDSGDKGSYKAMTGAQKYALMKAFMIPTGDDPEADSGTDERNEGNNNQQNNKPSDTGSNRPVGGTDLATGKQLDFVNDLLTKKATSKLPRKELYEHLKHNLGTQLEMEEWTKSLAKKAIELLQNLKSA